MFCCALLYAHSSFAIILMGKRELVAMLSCVFLVAVVVSWVCLQFVIVAFPYHTYLLFLSMCIVREISIIHACTFNFLHHNIVQKRNCKGSIFRPVHEIVVCFSCL